MSDLRDAQAKGFISKTPHFNSIFNYLENPALTPILRDLITETSLPLKAIETDFACDSSGFTTSRFRRWFDHKYGAVRQQHEWVKVPSDVRRANQHRDRRRNQGQGRERYQVAPGACGCDCQELHAQRSLSRQGLRQPENYKAIQRHGATPYIAFKSIHTGRGGGLWARMFHITSSTATNLRATTTSAATSKSTFSMIKAKFRDHVRSKTDVAMVNEVLCKIICHNICCLIQESHELGIDTTFWAETSPAQKAGVN